METEEEVDILMSSDIYSATLSTKSITFTRAQTGWLFREDKTVRTSIFKRHASCATVLPRGDNKSAVWNCGTDRVLVSPVMPVAQSHRFGRRDRR